MSPNTQRLTPGTLVAGYRIDGDLGAGAMGVVYAATQRSLRRPVALKLLAADYTEDPVFIKRFEREARVQAALNHRHIVGVYDSDQSEYGYYIAMQRVRGPNLKQLIDARALDPERALLLAGQVADALDAAHKAGLIHRDIKPQNILVQSTDHAFLADFGLTRTAWDGSLTQAGTWVGTVDYISPEQLTDNRAGPASDVYALAAVVYQCLTGEVPFPGESEYAVMHAHVSEQPPRLTDLRPDLPRALDDVLARGLAKDPAQRQLSAGELMRDAERALQPRRRPARAPALTRRRQWGWAIPVGLGALLSALVTSAFVLGSSQPGSQATAAPSQPVSAGALTLQAPKGWSRPAEANPLPGLDLKHPASLLPPGSLLSPDKDSLTFGVSSASGPTLLPAAFRRRLRAQPQPNDPMRVGALEAYRYARLRARGYPGRLTVYAAPTSAGVATFVCTETDGGQAFLDRCERAAASVHLDDARAYALGPDARYNARVKRVIGRLHGARARALARLRVATSPGGQAKAADALAHAYGSAAAALTGSTTNPTVKRVNAQLVSSLRDTQAAYAALARAARDERRASYRAARDRVARGEQRVRAALEATAKAR
jgi:serine/threonine protein kinase